MQIFWRKLFLREIHSLLRSLHYRIEINNRNISIFFPSFFENKRMKREGFDDWK